MEVSVVQINAWLGTFLWPFFRIAALLMMMPVFSARTVSTRVRLMLALAITIVVAPLIKNVPDVNPISIASLYIIAQQIIIGLLIGFALKMVLEIFILAGQIYARQSGLGFAMLVDPQSGISVPLVSQLYLMLTTLMFLAMNGHLILIEMLVQSFNTLPISGFMIDKNLLWEVVVWSKWIFAGAVVISLPGVAVLLLVYLAFGIMTKAAPQLNIFSIGFTVTIILGTVILVLVLPLILTHIENYMDLGFGLARSIVFGAH